MPHYAKCDVISQNIQIKIKTIRQEIQTEISHQQIPCHGHFKFSTQLLRGNSSLNVTYH